MNYDFDKQVIIVPVRVPGSMVKPIDAMARAEDRSRSWMVRELIATALIRGEEPTS